MGGMIICETSNQARLMYSLFDEVQNKINADSSVQGHLKAGLILYDSDDKETREKIVDDFKRNFKIDILIVFNMLLTGFDALRLKRLYLGRKLKDHGLLQAITRVNRPYKSNKYGYIVDFADIKKNFEETNAAYLRELNRFSDPKETGLDNKPNTYAQVIEDKDALIAQMKAVRQTLFEFTTDNMEEFSSEISTIEDKEELLRLKKALMSARDTYNIVRTFGDDKLKEEFSHLEIENLSFMISEVQRHINNINLKESFDTDDSTKQLVNEAMLDITFNFQKIGEEEMRLISGGNELNDKWRNVIMKFTENMDPDDPEYITLQEAFRQRFHEHGFVIDNIDQFYERSKELDEILKKLNELQRKNNALLKKYRGDTKFARVHKRIREENERRQSEHKKPIVSLLDEQIMEFLLVIKTEIDQKVYDKNDILKKDAFFEQTVMSQITLGMDKLNFTCEREDRLFIRSRIARQYLSQYNATYAA